jgi:LTXXQ motif family protein
MKKVILAGVAAVAIIGSSAVYAQHRFHHHHHRLSAEDRAAFVDAKIAAVKAGLKLTPDQEKNWPAVESAVRDFAKQRIDFANARMKERDARRAERRQDNADSDASRDQNRDPVTRLRERADRMAATAAGLKKIADAADPLYKSLDDGQKRRLAMLTRMGGKHGWRRHGFGDFERRMNDDGDQDHGSGRHRGSEGSERL